MSKIVDRTLDFFELFARERRPLTLSDIARLLEIPLSSCHDVVGTLRNRGYLYEVGPRAGFYPTQRLREISDKVTSHEPIVQRADEHLRQLRDEIGESVALSKSSGMRLAYVLVLESANPLRFEMISGAEVRSYHATSGGKAFLGRLSVPDLVTFLSESDLRPLTPHTHTDISTIVDDVRTSEARGWFGNHEESVEGATTVSARFDWHGSSYVITVAGPTARIAGRIDAIGARLAGICAELGTAATGHAPRP